MHARAVLRLLENAETQVAELGRQSRGRGLVPGLVRWDTGSAPPSPASG
jgi:hypothetical protein